MGAIWAIHETRSMIGRFQRTLQRRGYISQHTLYESPWERNKAKIVVGGVLALCCGPFVANLWANQRAQNLRDDKPLTFIKENFICSLENVREGRWWVTLSSSLTHFSPMHLAVNGLSLWSAGQFVIGIFGIPAFVGIWITSALSCSAASLYWEAEREEARKNSVGQRWDGSDQTQKRKWLIPKNGTDTGVVYGGSVGASGAISGLFSAMTCFAPFLRMGVPLIPFSMPAWAFEAVFAGGTLYCMESGSLPWIGHAGHLGGLMGGILYYYIGLRPWLRRMPRF